MLANAGTVLDVLSRCVEWQDQDGKGSTPDPPVTLIKGSVAPPEGLARGGREPVKYILGQGGVDGRLSGS